MKQASWYNEITKDREDRMKGVVYALNLNNENQSDFDKGVASDLMWEDFISIKKTGKEIKDKLQESKMKTAEMLIEIVSKLTSLKTKIGEEPTEKEYDGSEIKIYPYSSIYESENKESEICKLKREYNHCAYEKERLKKEMKYLKTIVDGIDEKKTYELKPRIASTLGF